MKMFFVLFTSLGTLLCCALPILLVTLGLGAAVASTVSALPWLVPLTANKAWVFAFSGVMIGLGFWLTYRPGRTCPTEPALAAACQKADTLNRIILWVSGGIWLVGLFFAYAYLPLLIAISQKS